MIKLFNPTDKSFDTNGLGGLSDAISCKVVEERNGEFELEMEYPINGIHYSDIKLRSIILAKPNPFDDPQPFRVYGISKPINGIVTINAQHLSYDLSGIPISPFNASGVVAATAALKTNAVVDCPFTFSTDKTDTGEYALAAPTSIRALLGSDTGSLLSVYGGEYEFDKYNVILHKSRGENRGVTIAYGKNLTDLKQEENCSNVYTGVYPFYYAEDDGLQTIDEKILNVGTYDYVKILPLDLSSEFSDGMPTSAVLKAKAQEYIDNNDIGNPTVSLSISFISLKKSKEYELIHILEEVKLCDIVNVEFPALGVSSVSQCIKTEYDVINDDYTSLELGDVQTTLADTVAQQTAAISNQMSNKEVADIVDSATALITGAKGGYVVFHSATAGSKYPEEILVMDTNDINTATNVWRWNKNGLGFSSSGYNGTYNLAMTADGKINADFIKTGSLAIGSNFYVDSSGNLTSNGGSITGAAINNGNGTFTVDANGCMTASNANISGSINAYSGNIGSFTIQNNTHDGYIGYGLQCNSFYNGQYHDVLINDNQIYIRNITSGNQSVMTYDYIMSPSISSTNEFVSAGTATFLGTTIDNWGDINFKSSAKVIRNKAGNQAFNPLSSSGNVALSTNDSGNGDTNIYAGGKIMLQTTCKTSSGATVTSDRNMKKNIFPVDDKYIKLFDELKPVSFEYKNGVSGRTHLGYIAQDVKAAMDDVGLTDIDFAGWCKDKNNNELKENRATNDDGTYPEYTYALRYDELTMLAVAKVKQLDKTIKQLEAEIQDLNARLKKLEDSNAK